MVPSDAPWPPMVPRARAVPHHHEGDDPDESPAVAGVTVLLAEDDPLVRAVAARVLAREGFVVLLACDGAEALALAAGHPEVDLLISDMRMPGMTGLELATTLRRARPGLPVLLMSGYTEEGALAVDAADEFLVKPFPPSELLAGARRAIDRRRSAASAGTPDVVAG